MREATTRGPIMVAWTVPSHWRTRPAHEKGDVMRTLRLSLMGAVILALLAGMGGVVAAQSGESDAQAFPTGALVSVENNYLLLEFYEDGTGFGRDALFGDSVSFAWATNGDLYSEMTNDAGRQVPATYYWDFDGELLTMDLWGEDLIEHRNFMYADNTWVPVDDPVLVVVAGRDIEGGDPVVPALMGFVSAAEAGPDVFTAMRDVVGYVAVVPISEGQPITPDLLEPVE